jgi:hypothetical protein
MIDSSNRSNNKVEETQHEVAVVSPGRRRVQLVAAITLGVLIIAAVTVVLVVVPPNKSDKNEVNVRDSPPEPEPDRWAECYEDSLSWTTNAEYNLYYAFDDMMSVMVVTCDHQAQDWPNCVLEEPGSLYEPVFEDACFALGGTPIIIDDLSTQMICRHMAESNTYRVSTDDMVGVEMEYFAVCAVPSCPDTDSKEFRTVVLDLAVDLLKIYKWLDCEYKDYEPISERIHECQNQFSPTGMICKAQEDKCGFFTVLDGSNCQQYCELHSGECLYSGGYTDTCVSQYDERKSCTDVVFDDWCTCTFTQR